jgi:hypothetical protein
MGGRFEGHWTVRWMLDVMAGRAQSIVIEERGEGGEGVEFTVVTNDGQSDSHQVKRQRGNRNGWSLRELEREGVLAAAAARVADGRRFWFVSLVPARDLDELSDQARRSDDLDAFRSSLSKELEARFSVLSGCWGGPQAAFQILQKVYVEWPSERQLKATNAVLAELQISGASGPAAAASLAALASEQLGRTLDAQAIIDALADFELTAGGTAANTTTSAAIDETLASWTRSVERELLDPEIPRAEANEVTERLRSGQNKVLLVAGAAGHGKSAVLHQAVRELARDWPVAAMRVDGLGDFASTYELGTKRLGLEGSPIAALAAAAKGQDCLLVVDQLDALSLASGRLSERFNPIADLIDEAAAFPNMRVLLACRQFDIDNDNRLAGLVSEDGPADQLSVGPLDDEQVDGAVAAMGLDPAALNPIQRELLKVPLHLVLLAAVADQPRALGFSSAKGLMDAFYERKRDLSQARREQNVRFDEMVGILVEDMSAHQRLYVPEAVVEVAGHASDAKVLESEHVLVERTDGYSFFHEAFFDYAFARRWLAREQTLVAFLLEGEQELFRRAQVRQVLIHLRADQPERFVSEVEGLLADHAIRFHIKEVVLALLRALDSPTQAEWQMVQRILASEPAFSDRVFSMLRTAPWFDRLDAEGIIEAWLTGDEEHLGRAADVMITVARERADRLAQILGGLGPSEIFDNVLRHVGFYVDLHASRAFFELTLDAVRRGVFDQTAHNLFMSAHALGQEQPEWAVELLDAWFVQRTDALALDADGKVAALDGRDHGIEEIISAASARAPGDFAEFAVPLLLDVMALTSSGDRQPKRDRHFAFRVYNSRHHDVDDALLYGARDALRSLIVSGEHDRVAPLLDVLEADEHDAAQWLLYEALAADGKAHAERAVALLCQGEHRMLCGYTSDSYWSARELVVSIGPHLTGDQRAALEEAFISLRPHFESRPFGRGSFRMLSALPEDDLSAQARGRLRELRRVFGERPSEPRGIETGTITSPIPASAAEKMTDEQWLRAIAKHHGDARDWRRFTGGASELASVLQERTKGDPERFCQLALKLDDQTHPAYLNAILYALREVGGEVEPELVFEVMRHVASLRRSDHDRALPDALARLLDTELPDDIIGLVLDIARHSADPDHEAWQREAWGGDHYYGGDPFHNGINTARGSAAMTLGDLLVHDSDGARTVLIAPHLSELAADRSLAVRSCVAHVLSAALRHARDHVAAAFPVLIDAPDELLGTRPIEELVYWLGISDNAFVGPVVERMIGSAVEEVQEAGGRLAAYAGLELGLPALLDSAVQSPVVKVRAGAATVCAHRLAITAESERAGAALMELFNDAEGEVRDNAAEVADALRGRPLEPHRGVIEALIASAAFEEANSQLLITLEQATERVDDLILSTASRFITTFKGQMASIATHAATDAREVGALLLRAYAQAQSPEARSDVLDLIDDLLIEAAYDFAKTVGEAER